MTLSAFSLLLLGVHFTICNTHNTTFNQPLTVEQRLIKQLLATYERIGKLGRPVRNTSQTITIAFGLSLFQLLHLDEKNQMLTINVWNKFTWRDELLKWNPKDHSGLTTLRIPVKHIWIPDIVLYNYADTRLQELREVLLNVDYTGLTFWSPPAIYKSFCKIDMKYFPFDHQVCYLRFASWTQDGKKVDLTFFQNRSEVSLEEYRASNEWRIVAKPAIRRFFKQTCCKDPFPTLIFFVVLKRNPAFYAYLLVLPCLLLACLNLVTFWLPPQVPARMLLGMNIFVGFCILMKFLTTSTPSASNSIPYLGYYCCLNMVLIAISTFVSLIAVNLHFRCNKQKQIPSWLLKFVDGATVVLGLRQFSNRSDDEKNKISKYEVKAAKVKASQCTFKKDCFQCHLNCPKCCCPHIPGPQMERFQNSRYSPVHIEKCFINGCIECQRSSRESFKSVHRSGASIVKPMRAKCKCSHCLSSEAYGSEFKEAQVCRFSVRQPVKPPSSKMASMKQSEVPETAEQNSAQLSVYNGVTAVQTSGHQIERNLSEIKRALHNLMNKVGEKDKAAKRVGEWALVAMTIDRLCFWIYLLVIAASGFGMLIPTSYSYKNSDITKQFDNMGVNLF